MEPVRYIPTLVGRFFSASISRQYSSVHPHACGEITNRAVAVIFQHGTSPRLWGDCLSAPRGWQRHRYIPTLVGRFIGVPRGSTSQSVHPHACGEIHLNDAATGVLFGTSPRLWGDCKRAIRKGRRWRYIPTLVGRFTLYTRRPRSTTVHPHACGEIPR